MVGMAVFMHVCHCTDKYRTTVTLLEVIVLHLTYPCVPPQCHGSDAHKFKIFESRAARCEGIANVGGYLC